MLKNFVAVAMLSCVAVSFAARETKDYTEEEKVQFVAQCKAELAMQNIDISALTFNPALTVRQAQFDQLAVNIVRNRSSVATCKSQRDGTLQLKLEPALQSKIAVKTPDAQVKVIEDTVLNIGKLLGR